MARPEIQIQVCVNERPAERGKPSCAPLGSLAVYRELKARVKQLGLHGKVMVVRSGCLKHCSRGATVAVWPFNYWYAGVTLADLDEILQRTVLGGEEIERLRMPDIPWE